MKKLLTLAAVVGVTTLSYAQGTFNFANTSGTLISAGGTSSTGLAGDYIYAVFFAPSTTALAGGQLAGAYTNAAFQAVGGTNASVATAGRMASRNGIAETSNTLPPGSTVDFIVRGWSKNAGATWAEALAFYNNAQPAQDMYLGQSVIGNDLVLGGGAIPVNGLFGVNAFQLNTGFNMLLIPAIPEPSSMVLAGLGAASLLMFRRRK
jgi:hypothetical protein